MVPFASLEPHLAQKLMERGDQHVVCLTVDPFFEKNAWVENLPYPAGKTAGLGLVGGRSESFAADQADTFIETLHPRIRRRYKKLFECSKKVFGCPGNQWTEPPECTALREMFEETGIVGRLFTWTEEHTTKNNKTGGMKTEFRLVTRFEGAILNRNSRINRLLVAIQYLKHHLEREPTREEIAEEIRRRTPLESQEHWRRTLEYLQGQLGRDPTADEIVAELKQRNDDESNPYWRTVFICVAMNPGDENTQALSPEGPPQTQGFQWLPIAAPPHIETNEERWDREQKDGPAPKHAYYTHVHTVLDARILSALERIKLQPDINAEPGEDIATLRALWKTAGASDTKILN